MVRLSCLTDPAALLVADASVVINLIATRCSEDILDALPNQVVVVEEVSLELEHGRRQGRNDADALSVLVAARRMRIVRFGTSGERYFNDLVSGPAVQTLDDGEAATIAYALEHSATALIDERKANNVCANRFPKLAIGCTVDLLAHHGIQASLGREELADAVFNALHDGRMRVMPHFAAWAVDLVGPERAAECSSLPKSVRPAKNSLAVQEG